MGANVRHRPLLEMTIPDKPQSSKQRYRLTAQGKALRDEVGQ